MSLSEVVPEKNQKSNRLASSIMIKSGRWDVCVSMVHEYISPEILSKNHYLQMHIIMIMNMIMNMIMMCVVCYNQVRVKVYIVHTLGDLKKTSRQVKYTKHVTMHTY